MTSSDWPGSTVLMAFIVFEGLDGSGKSTQIQRLQDFLVARGQAVRLTREPGGTPLAEEIRNLLLRVSGEAPAPRCELLLYEAARAQHMDRVIRPALARQEWVLCDRFTGSTVAFQKAGRGLQQTDVEWLNGFASDHLQPDLVVLLDLPVSESVGRRQKRYQQQNSQADRFESEHTVFHEKVRQSYLAQAQEQPNRWFTVDGCLSEEEIARRILVKLRELGWLES